MNALRPSESVNLHRTEHIHAIARRQMQAQVAITHAILWGEDAIWDNGQLRRLLWARIGGGILPRDRGGLVRRRFVELSVSPIRRKLQIRNP